MARKSKNSKKNVKPPQDPIPWTTSETRGFLVLAFAFVLLLSLISFATAPDSKNLLGMMGYSLGWAFHAIFGLGSYILVIYLSWIGWRLLFCKPLRFLWLKNIYVAAAIFSFCLLLSLIEKDAPSFAQSLGTTFYPGLWAVKMRYHLGGAPFYYLYSDMPAFNLNHIFNTVGAALIFSSILIASLIFLFKISLIDICQHCIDAIKQNIARRRDEKLAFHLTQNAVAKEEAKKPEQKAFKGETSNESDFLRFVKLRIPTTLQDPQAKINAQNASSPDLLGIQPEQNLKIRPSISRKEQSENDINVSDTNLLRIPSIRPKKTENSPESIHAEEEDLREAFKKPQVNLAKDSNEKLRRREAALTSQRVHNGDFTNFTLPGGAL